MQRALGGASVMLLFGACAVEAPSDPQGDDNLDSLDQAVLTSGCTTLKLVAPLRDFQVGAGFPTTLSASVTCPAGVTPEFQYWARPASAQNWSIIGAFVPGSTSWAIPWVGAWCIEVVSRAAGTSGYDLRSSQVCGTAIHINLNPVTVDDDISTTLNVPGSVDVLANDSDPDGDTITLTGHADPAHGAVVFVGSVATYTPTHGYLGLDSFTYAVSDGLGGSASGTVNINVADLPPVAVADTLTAFANTPATVDVLANDSDPDGDPLTVASFSQGAHGSVAFTGGVATYTPVTGYTGSDAFTYAIDDGHGLTAVATVNVTVTLPTPGCTISIAGPASGVFGQNLHLTASAACNTGLAQLQWYHKATSGYVIVQAWSTTATLDFVADNVGASLFYALVRTQGTTAQQGKSNTLSIPTADNTPQCTSVKVTAPLAASTLHVGLAQTLSATSVCPAGATAEYQFWVKATSSPNWTILPGYTTGSSSWTPAATGAWQVKAAVRSVGSHVIYQISSSTVSVTVAP
ncbi:MAG: cadherin-like domain-containing protein [Kofleriaceae bacterium]